MTDISGKTAICGVIGDPIEHTMSPAMHNAAFAALGLDYAYLAFRVNRGKLEEAVKAIRALNIRGMNVTIPHKVAAMPLLDAVDPLAGKIGAINTIVNEDGILTGYNTDATGFLRALLETGSQPEGLNTVILGAGGAARAIAFILAENGARLTILNRREELDWAEKLAESINREFSRDTVALELNEKNLGMALTGAKLLVNATSVGMSPESQATPVPANLLRHELAVFDIVYNPLETRLLREARQAGAVTISGLDMLVWQGARAFTLWTGREAPVEIMKREAMKVLTR